MGNLEFVVSNNQKDTLASILHTFYGHLNVGAPLVK